MNMAKDFMQGLPPGQTKGKIIVDKRGRLLLIKGLEHQIKLFEWCDALI